VANVQKIQPLANIQMNIYARRYFGELLAYREAYAADIYERTFKWKILKARSTQM